MNVETKKRDSEIEEKMEAETEVNNKGEQQKSDEVVSGRITFPDNPPS